MRGVSRLQVFPLSGKAFEELSRSRGGYRILVTGRYIVIYRYDDGLVEVVRIVHALLDYTRLL